jgi:hypothetical protein
LGPAAHSGAAALTGIRTGRHETFERLVFDFNRAFGTARVRYVPAVHADPSDLLVALQGNAFLEVTVHDAYARWGGGDGGPTYPGPDSVLVGYPTLRQVAISGDFEAVLSFGIGLDRTAGFRVMRLYTPDRLVIDVADRPAWRMWPDTSMAQAQVAQRQFENGELPWRGSVVAYYARMVYGWTEPVVVRVPGTDEYLVSDSGSTERIRVRQVWPFRDTRPSSVAEIANVR